MTYLSKKPSLLCSAFAFLILTFAFSLEAAVDCSAQGFNYQLTRSEIANTGSNATEQTKLVGSKVGMLVNQQVDLNIQVDVNALADGVVTVISDDIVWRVLAENKDKVRGYILANYQFQGVSPNDNKICSSPMSCIDITSITPVNQFVDRQGNNDAKPNKSIIEASESLQLTLDLSGARDSGAYSAIMTVTLLHDADADGIGEQPLACDITS